MDRHVQDRRHATRGGRCGRRRETLPVGPAGFVHMDVGIHQARQQREPAEILLARSLQPRVILLHRLDLAILNG